MPRLPALRIQSYFRLSTFDDEILVECPNCRLCARAARPSYDRSKAKYLTRISCLHCAAQREVATSWDYWNHLPLWLRTNCCGEVLWALNSKHLEALEPYVAAGLRQNKLGYSTNRHLYMSLPRWISSKKNRPDVLRGLKRLRVKLARAL